MAKTNEYLKPDVRIRITSNSFSVENKSGSGLVLMKMKYNGQFDARFNMGYIPALRPKSLYIMFTNKIKDDTIFLYEGSVKFTKIKFFHINRFVSAPSVKWYEQKWSKLGDKYGTSVPDTKWDEMNDEISEHNRQGLSSVTFKDIENSSEIRLTSDFAKALNRVFTKEQLSNSIGVTLRKGFPFDFDKRSEEYRKSYKKSGDK